MKSLVEEIKLYFSDREFRLGELTIDAVLKESHDLHAQISEHPTESGESFCDHISNSAITVKIDGIITNTPLTFIGLTAANSLTNFIDGKSNDRVSAAFKKLKDIFAERTPIDIVTSLKDYRNMVLESLTAFLSSAG